MLRLCRTGLEPRFYWGRSVKMNDKQITPVPDEPIKDGRKLPPSDDRRELLKKLGRYGLYTAPALLLLFESEKAAASVSFTPPPG